MFDSKQLFRYSYLLIIGVLIGIFVAQYLPNARTQKLIASKNSEIQAKQHMIEGLLKELPTQN